MSKYSVYRVTEQLMSKWIYRQNQSIVTGIDSDLLCKQCFLLHILRGHNLRYLDSCMEQNSATEVGGALIV